MGSKKLSPPPTWWIAGALSLIAVGPIFFAVADAASRERCVSETRLVEAVTRVQIMEGVQACRDAAALIRRQTGTPKREETVHKQMRSVMERGMARHKNESERRAIEKRYLDSPLADHLEKQADRMERKATAFGILSIASFGGGLVLLLYWFVRRRDYPPSRLTSHEGSETSRGADLQAPPGGSHKDATVALGTELKVLLFAALACAVIYGLFTLLN